MQIVNVIGNIMVWMMKVNILNILICSKLQKAHLYHTETLFSRLKYAEGPEPIYFEIQKHKDNVIHFGQISVSFMLIYINSYDL